MQGSGGQIVLSGKFYRSKERWAVGPGCCCLVTLLEPVSAELHRIPSKVGVCTCACACPHVCALTSTHTRAHTHAHEHTHTHLSQDPVLLHLSLTESDF